jgi:hypothetical protein
MWLALTPSIATFGPDGLAIVTTSPSGRSGVVWELFQQRGVREGMLTVQFPTWEMNPHVTRKQLDEEFKRDETLARQEYGAEFLAPHGRFLNNDDIAACVVENPAVPSSDARWHMHVDLGLIHDATAIAIGIIEENTPSEDGDIARIAIARLEVLEGSPESPVKMTDVERRIVSIASDMPRKSRGTVTFDQFQSAFVVERLRAKGIDARIVPATARTNQESFALLRDLIATRRISFPDHPRLLDELRNLECTPTPNGFRVEAARGFTDDCADSIAMVAWLLSQDNRWGDMLTIIERRG